MGERRGHILLLEHNKAIADEIADRLAARGFYVEIVSEVDPALEADIDEGVDVLICDIDMPGISWDAVWEVLTERPLEISAIMLSATSDMVQVMTALRLGFSDYFLTPIDDWDALFNCVGRCMAQSALRRENAAYREQLEQANAELRGNVRMLEQDQQAGRHVQMRMLPQSPLLLGDYVFSHSVIPSLYLSGDFTDYFLVGDRHASFVIADVSGHGSSSAFVTVLLKNLFARKRSDYLHRDDPTIMSPLAMLELANRDLLELGIGKFATLVVGLIDLEENMLRYSVAGHLPLPVLVTAEGAQYLQGEGSAVGIMEDAGYQERELELPAQFTLALFSDGILEILPPKDLVDKEKYFLQVFEESCDSPEQMVSRLGLDKVSSAPDDIAALFIGKRA
ncbi:MAG: SpoIIE family protein phosphatase [Gammaproteobacteria bacterium]|nr:SpoIIE family protein phosphatase [Gammaproteobacteria bacterium]